MKYKGIELIEITEPQSFNQPKPMLVWDSDEKRPVELNVCAIVNREDFRVITERSAWRHCAEIPKQPKPVTYRELSRWLAEGKGEFMFDSTLLNCNTYLCYSPCSANKPVCDLFVRKWKDTEWHKPTREYLGLGDK